MIEVKIPNLKKLRKALKSHPRLFVQEFNKAIYKAGFKIQAESKKVTPVDTGRLRASISTDTGFLQAIISPHTDYAIYVHEGTRYMRKRPFMEKGLKSSERFILNTFKEAEDNVLKKIAQKSK